MFLGIIIIVSFITLYHTMANLEIGSSQELFDTTDARILNEQEMQTMFDDKFFKDLESNDPLVKIEKIEGDWKVYFSKPDNTDKTKLRDVWQGGTFVDIFYISKENRDNIVNRRTSISWAVQTTQAETQQLNQEVTTTNTPQESPETLWVSVEAHTDALLNWFEDFSKKRPISKRPWESHDTKERLKEVIRNDIAYLKSVKRELKRYTYTSNPEIFQEDLDTLESHKQSLIEARQIITGWGNTSELPTILASLKDIKRADKFENKMAKYNRKVNELLKDATLKELWNKDMEWFQDYLEDVWSGAIEHPAQHPFYTQHMRDFQHIQSINPTLYTQITTCQNPRRNGWSQYVEWNGWNGAVVVCQGRPGATWNCETFASSMWKKIADCLEAVWLNKEQDPRKRASWEKIWSFAALWWAIFLWVKFFKTLFTSGKNVEHKWWKVAWYWAWLLALLNNDAALKLFKDATGWHPEEKAAAKQQMQNYGYTQNETGELLNYYTAPSMYVLNTMSGFPVWDMVSQNIIQTGTNWLIFNYENYAKYIEALAATNPTTYTKEWKDRVLSDAKRLAESESMFRAWMAALGITWVQALQTLQQQGQTLKDSKYVSDSYTQYIEWLSSWIGADLYKQGLKMKPEYVLLINDDLKNSNNKNELIVKWLKSGYLTLVDQNKNYDIEEIINDPNIDLEHKTMKWFVNGGGMHIEFNSYEELFDTVHLTNWIKKNFAGRQAVSENPFHIDIVTRRLEFDDVEWYKVWKNETSILKARTLKNTSSLLANNKQFYVNYLNRWWKEDQKHRIEWNKINLTEYPMLKEVWIDFVNKNEAEKSEELLRYIKHELRMREKRDVWKAFEISNIYLWVTTKTRIKFFTKQDSKTFDISDFPTLIREQNKLLSYLNNPDNKMRWSERPV